MSKNNFDIIVIGCGSGGLSVGLFMAQAGFKVMMVSTSDHAIGGDCLNDGCVPSKSFIHVAKIAWQARQAAQFGMQVSGNPDMKKATQYVYERQELIRAHENADWLRKQGVTVALGTASFSGPDKITVAGNQYQGRKIVIATGSRPKKLEVPGVDKVDYYDNENIFTLEKLPPRLLVIGGGPIGIEIAQAMSRLGSKVTVVNKGSSILEHDDLVMTNLLKSKLIEEGIEFKLQSAVETFSSATEAVLKDKDNKTSVINFDAVFVAIGRELNIEKLQLQEAGINVEKGKIVADKYLRTSNKKVLVCGDVAGSLQFSHAAEFHARIILNNLFSPLKKKLNNDHMSWVTFTDPELATFGLHEKQLKEKGIRYITLADDFREDDRAVTDNYQYAKVKLFISAKSLFGKQRILGGTMLAPNAGELIQELILANAAGLSINSIFNKIYPYPVAARINQKLLVTYKSSALTVTVKKMLNLLYKIFN